MEKKYTEIDFYGGQTIESAVNELLGYKEKGMLTCGIFNGVMLYSDTVTIDNAYIKIIGKSKEEHEEDCRKWREERERNEKEHQNKIPELMIEWIKKGHKVLTEDRWESWDKVVPARLSDLYQGMELGCCLDIIKILNNGGSLDEAKAMINSQDHSGMSFSLVCAMVKEFCERGKEFAEYVR